MNLPRIVVAGLSGDSGKTVVSLALAASLRRSGTPPAVFKKGPDYIDAAWLARIAGTPCRNLDTWLVDPSIVLRRFVDSASSARIALVEGNRGIHDGVDAEGTHSTAELARLISAPVLLVVNAAKVTRTVAAIINGVRSLPPAPEIAGVVLNRVAGERHERTIRAAVEKYCQVPVLGVLPRLDGRGGVIPGRHLGLVTPEESGGLGALEERLVSIASRHLDVAGIVAAAGRAGRLPEPGRAQPGPAGRPGKHVQIGVFRDSAFSFYYPENLEALEAAGAELVPVSALNDPALPSVHALYIGGGFPETHAERLGRNAGMLASVREAIGSGVPAWAECGGLIYLSRSLSWKGKSWPMAGVIPLDLEMGERPAGHGYTRLVTDRENPFLSAGTVLKGHEFHYSRPVSVPADAGTCMRVEVGTGLGGGRDGSLCGNALACYTHLHADSFPGWAGLFVARAEAHAAGS